MGRNLSNLYISQSYQFITQISGSELQDGLGNTINNLTLTASFANSASNAIASQTANTAISASYALTASYASNVPTVNTSSLLVTASAAQNVVTFTKGDGSTFPVTIATGSAVTVNTGSLLVTSSISNATITFTKGDGSTYTNTVNNVANATSASYALNARYPFATGTLTGAGDIPIVGADGSGGTGYKDIYFDTKFKLNADTTNPAGGTGVMTVPFVQTTGFNSAANSSIVGRLSVTGSVVSTGGFTGSVQGNATTATSASYAATASIATSSSYALSASFATSATTAATASYVVTALTASNTPNAVVNATVSNATITYTKGDGTTFANTVNNVANATSASYAVSSSYAVNATNATTAGTASFIPSNVNLNVASISASSAVFQSASIGFLTTITGSVVNIGDAFVILNTSNATRYAGIKVEDSGSATPQNYTASFQFDSQTNDWFYEYSGSDPTNYGVAMFGPEYGTKGSPTYLTNNRLPKGNGGHHLNDSTITDDGVNVTFTTPIVGTQISASTGFSGNLTGTASFASSASNAIFAIGAGAANSATSASYAQNATSASFALTASYASNVTIPTLQSVTTAGATTNVAVTINNTASADYWLVDTKPFANLVGGTTLQAGRIDGADEDFVLAGRNFNGTAPAITMTDGVFIYNEGSHEFTGSVKINDLQATGSLFGSASYATNATYATYVNAESNNFFTAMPIAAVSLTGGPNNDEILYNSAFSLNGQSPYSGSGAWLGTPYIEMGGFHSTNNGFITGSLNVKGDTIISGSINVSGSVGSSNLISNNTDTFTGSPKVYEIVTCTQAEYNTVSGSANAANTLYVITDNTGSGAYIEGAVQGNVSALTITSNTASLDCDAANFFTLTLVSGSNTYINPTNINSGQTINLRITQANPGNGTVSFPSSVKQVSGSAYTPSAGSGPVDIVTFIAFDNSSLYLSNVKNLV